MQEVLEATPDEVERRWKALRHIDQMLMAVLAKRHKVKGLATQAAVLGRRLKWAARAEWGPGSLAARRAARKGGHNAHSAKLASAPPLQGATHLHVGRGGKEGMRAGGDKCGGGHPQVARDVGQAPATVPARAGSAGEGGGSRTAGSLGGCCAGGGDRWHAQKPTRLRAAGIVGGRAEH